jgi:hypothetical protein
MVLVYLILFLDGSIRCFNFLLLSLLFGPGFGLQSALKLTGEVAWRSHQVARRLLLNPSFLFLLPYFKKRAGFPSQVDLGDLSRGVPTDTVGVVTDSHQERAEESRHVETGAFLTREDQGWRRQLLGQFIWGVER